MLQFVLFVVIFGFVLLLLSVLIHNHILIFFSSLVLMLIGIHTTINGWMGEFNWFTIALGIFIIGISFYIIIVSPFDMMEEI